MREWSSTIGWGCRYGEKQISNEGRIQSGDPKEKKEGDFKRCKTGIEEAVGQVPLPIENLKDEDHEEDKEVLKNLSQELFHILQLSFTLLDKIEEIEKGTMKLSEKSLMNKIYELDLRIKKIVEVEV